jgi:hypothetical protein
LISDRDKCPNLNCDPTGGISIRPFSLSLISMPRAFR